MLLAWRVFGILVIAGILLLLLQLPWSIRVSWRKPWGGSLLVRFQIQSVVGLALRFSHRQIQGRCWRWHGSCPADPLVWQDCLLNLSSGSLSPQFWLQILKALPSRVKLLQVDGSVEIGLADPFLTGQWIGLLSALPPRVARHLHLTFTQTGWRSRGEIAMQLRPIRVLDLGFCLIWHTLAPHLCRKMPVHGSAWRMVGSRVGRR